MDKVSIAILKLFEERNSLSCQDIAAILNADPLRIAEYISLLHSEKYITLTGLAERNENFSLSSLFRITPMGRGFLENLSEIRTKNRRENILKWCNFALSVIAIIISVISLLKK